MDPRLLHVLLGAVLASVAACQDPHTSDVVARMLPDGTWVELAPLPEGRGQHTTTLLADGRIVVAGGVLESEWRRHTDSVIIYSPVDGAWHDAGTLLEGHAGHRAFLVDAEHLLIVGGLSEGSELFDLTSGTSAPIVGPGAADNAVLALLTDGSMLAIGAGLDHERGVYEDDTVRRLDPGALTWRTLAPLDEPIRGGSLIPLPSGGAVRFLYAQTSTFDPVSETFIAGAVQDVGHPVSKALMMADGHIVTMGRSETANPGDFRYEFARYDPQTDLWTSIDATALPDDHVPASWPEHYLGYYTVALADGTVAIVRGADFDAEHDLGPARVYRLDPMTGAVTGIEGSLIVRFGQGVIAHPDGGLLFVGGLAEPNFLESLES
jgi:hypothetical protein